MALQDDDDEGSGLKYVDLDIINNWVVKLMFDVENKPTTGNGFFLNVPGDKHVILTAAHNLISDGKRTQNLKILYNNPFRINPDTSEVLFYGDSNTKKPIIEHPVINTEDNVHICEAYKKNIPVGDYGVIRIPRTFKDQRGFGFSLQLAYKKSFKGSVHVSGFKGDMMKSLRPLTSSSANMKYHENYVEYGATTEPGISGSPVWVEYKGYPTVVAVHNNGPVNAKPSSGSRGALLTIDLLHDVFGWLDPKLLQKNVQLQVRAQDRQKKLRESDHELFLSFMTNTGFGRVRLGSGTKFNWMLAQVDSNNIFYALAVAGEKKWVKFNTVATQKYKRVELSETMDGRGCLFLKGPPNDRSTWITLGVETGVETERLQLRMECTHIKVKDLRRETSEVSLVTAGTPESTLDFYKFIFKAD